MEKFEKTVIQQNSKHFIVVFIVYGDIQGVPKKMPFLLIFEFQTLGGLFSGVKNNSRNFENKKNNKSCLAKF